MGTPALLTDGQRVDINAMDLLAKLTHLDLAPALLDDVRALLARVELAEQNAQLVAVMEGMLQNKERIIEAKESLIEAKEGIIEAKESLIAVKESIIKSADIKIAALTLELAHHRRIRFAYKSEALSSDQRDLFEETWDIDLAAMQAELDAQGDALAQGKPKAKRPRAGRQPLPDHLVRIEHRHEPDSCQCGQCGSTLIQIGEDISEQLDVEPARFFVHRHIRPQYACRACATVTAALVPPAIIDGGMASSGLLAWLAISKFADHLPLYRIGQIGARQDVPLPISTTAEWLGKIGVALQPLAERMSTLLRLRPTLHADETPVRQLDPGKGKTKRAYLWAYRSNSLDEGPLIVVFDYQDGRGGVHAQTFLGNWRGHLMVDDYSGYKALFAGGVTELACLAHVRRKFFDLHAANGSPIAAQALRRIAQLYVVEQQARDGDVVERLRLRQEIAKPLLAQCHNWLITTRCTVADGSGTAKAIDHALKRWPALIRYADSGTLPIDNNPVENAIRPIAIGKKNWLFAGSERAGRRAAAIQSLLATAKLNGLEPMRWLTEILEKLPTCPNSQIDSLLPFAKLGK
jgi:transposase